MRQIGLLCGLITLASASNVGAEYRVNTRTSYDQTDPAVAMDSRGNYVVVWSSYRQDGDSGGVFGQRFDPNCQRVGHEFRINSEVVGNQTDPAVAMHETGGFVAVWHGPGPGDRDIYARRFGVDAEPRGDDFRVNSLLDFTQRFPRVAMSRTGAFVVVWESRVPIAEDYTWAAAGRLHDANGTPVGNEFCFSQLSDCRYPDAAMDALGNFVAVWMLDRRQNSIMARLYDAKGSPRTDPFQVNTIGFGSSTRPAVAMQYNGSFVVTWDGHEQRASLDDIHARWFDSKGTPLSEQFLVNTNLALAQQYPRISMTSQGEFALVWQGKSAFEYNARDVFARQYSASCVPVGNEARLDSLVINDQKYPVVVVSPGAKFVAAWQSYGQDGSGYGIFATSSARMCAADFSDDGFVNFRDYCVLADEWLETGDSLRADLIADEIISPPDLAEFCRNWLSPCQACRLLE